MRIDVTVKALDEIPDRVDFLRTHRIKKLDITHAHRDVNPVEVARRVKSIMPDAEVTLYVSAKYFSDSSMELSRASFRKAFEEAKKIGIKKFLFISGHPRSSFDAIEMLRIVHDRHLAGDVQISCSYNPYFDPGRLREEQERARTKMGFPFVKGICLQIGMDANKLAKGVEFLRSVRPDISLAGSVPVPSDATLNRLKLLALYGVFLPNSYLLRVDSAKEMTTDLLKTFKELKIEPIVFAPHINDLSEVLPMFA